MALIQQITDELKETYLCKGRIIGSKPIVYDGCIETGLFLVPRRQRLNPTPVPVDIQQEIPLITELVDESNSKIPSNSSDVLTWATVAYPIAVNSQPVFGVQAICNGNTTEKKVETIIKLDPEIDKHLALITGQLEVEDFSKNITFFVNQITRMLGINPETLKHWEEDKKIIRRTGTKIDNRHPTFNLVEAIWIGYINGSYIRGGITAQMRDNFRWYIKRYLDRVSERDAI